MGTISILQLKKRRQSAVRKSRCDIWLLRAPPVESKVAQNWGSPGRSMWPTHSTSCQSVMLLKRLFSASSPMWEQERKARAGTACEKRLGKQLASCFNGGPLPTRPTTRPRPEADAGGMWWAFPVGPSHQLGLCAWSSSAWLWASLRPEGACLWEIRTGKGCGFLSAQDSTHQRWFLSQATHVHLFLPSFWMPFLVQSHCLKIVCSMVGMEPCPQICSSSLTEP